MASMVIDLREEMDASLAPPSSPQPPPPQTRKQAALASKLPTTETRATFLIRTLPRDCNPTPVTATTPLTLQPSASSSSLLLSPRRGAHELVLNSDSSDVPDNPFDDLTEDKLRQLSGKQDLSRVTTLQLSVDASKQSLEVIGELLPSLQQLRLVSSSLGSFRDLGTSLHALLVLHVPRCGLRDLDGISALTGLQELYVPHNAISDISPLTMHEELRVVDLESNCIVDVGQIEQLAFCPQLTALSLLSNPVCKIERFRQIVSTFVPQLVTLDRVELSREDQQRLPDEVIDAAIRAFRAQRDAEDAASAGATELSSPTRTQDSGADSVRDDYGSTLTHGTDIVFAGNVTSALRRRRSETEGDNDVPVSRPQTPSTTTLERPSTPARESITATLDRAHELDRQQHKSRDAILHELRAWRLETAGASQVGVVALDSISPAPSPERRTQRPPRPATPKAASQSTARATERRPQTSAGVLRGAVREAFVETPSSQSTASTQRTVASTQRTVVSTQRTVDILVLDDGPSSRRPSNNTDNNDDNDNDDVPCSPRKTARGVFSPMDAGSHDDLQLLLLPTPRSRSTSRRRGDSNADELEDQDGALLEHGADADSDSDDEDLRRMARALKQRRPPPEKTSTVALRTPPSTLSTMVDAEPPATQQRSPFLDVAASLQAIDQWREQMDEPSSPSRGPACAMTDEQLASWLRERATELKTRDAFRRFFRGISEQRLTRVLQSVFREHQQDKIRRRLQLMQGFFGSG